MSEVSGAKIIKRTFNLTPETVAKLQAMARARAGGNQSFIIRQLIQSAKLPGRNGKRRQSKLPFSNSAGSVSTTLN